MADTRATKEAVAAEMAWLRSAYLDRLPTEIQELTVLADGLGGNEADRAQLEDLYQRLHKLAGSGGTFGLAALSTRARSLEQQIKNRLAESLDGMSAELRDELSADIAALRSTLTEVTTSVTVPRNNDGATHPEDKAIQLWLVEDDEMLDRELERQLKPFGFEIRLFNRISAAEAAAQAEQPDILIMDVLFSEEQENATEVMALRPHLRSLGCPLIFISSHGGFRSRVRAARLGAEGYLLKPLDVPRLVERVEHIMAKRHAPPQRVLIVDDDVDLSEHYRLALTGAGMEAETLNQPEDIIERVAAFHPELVLMDMHMPDYSGADLAGVIRQHDNWISLPIVYLSAEMDFDKQVQALGQGADDFLTKPIADAHLIAAVTVRVERARQLADQITKDSLTGLLKHASIKEAADIEVLRAHRMHKPASLAMVDIDFFKKVNDTHGHAVGDLVIKSLATLLRQRLRQSDLIGRYGGEEFVAVLPECDLESARLIMDDVRERFANLQFNHEGTIFGCTLSVGLVCTSQYPLQNSGQLLIAADQALYAAKHGGRNQVCLDPAPGG